MYLWYRRRPAHLVVSLTFCTLVYLVLEQVLHGQGVLVGLLAGSRSPSRTPDPEHLRVAQSTTLQLQAFEQEPTNISDLNGMGERVKTFSSLAEVIKAEPLLGSWRLVNLLRTAFPWLDADRLSYVPWMNTYAPEGDKTGIVMCVGASRTLYAAHLISTLRNVLGSTLPIQIAYAGDDDLPPAKRNALISLGPDIEALDLLEYFGTGGAGLEDAHWGQKPFALLASRFERAILVDADVIFLQKPDDVFSTEPGLVATGTLFWHDRAIRCSFKPVREWLQSVLGYREPSAMLKRSMLWKDDVWHQQESGVVCVDKARIKVFMSVVFAAWMNSGSVRDDETYQHVWGDKETYWLAAELTSTEYHFMPWYGGAIGVVADDNSTICSTHIVHPDSQKKLFWFNGSLREDKYKEKRTELARLTHWLVGSAEYSEYPMWQCISDGMTWCLSGETVPAVQGTAYEGLIEDIKREGVAVDERFAAVEL